MSANCTMKPLRFSTQDWLERDRVEVLREIYGRTITNSTIEPLDEKAADIEATFYPLPGLALASVASCGFRLRRTRAQADPDSLVLTVSLSGGRSVSQRGRETMIGEGEAFLVTVDTADGVIQSGSRFFSLRMPVNAIKPLVSDLESHLVWPVPRENDALRLLTTYLGAICSAYAPATTALQRAMVNHIHDLAALAVGATRDAREVARMRGVPAARLQAIKADIANNLEGDLSAGALAARHKVSPRYIQMLFERDGTTLSEFVLEQRLVRAYRLLGDPRLAHRTIGAVAFAAGFGDLSYFNRTFRRRFGDTPKTVRAQAE
jgi:AraC-like DNA-binding protein